MWVLLLSSLQMAACVVFFHTICHCPPLVGFHPLFLLFSLFFSIILQWQQSDILVNSCQWRCYTTVPSCVRSTMIIYQFSVCILLKVRCENSCKLCRMVHITEVRVRADQLWMHKLIVEWWKSGHWWFISLNFQASPHIPLIKKKVDFVRYVLPLCLPAETKICRPTPVCSKSFG